MCDGQQADDCDVMNLSEFNTTLNDRLAKLNNQFSTLSDILKAKKEAFIEMYRKDPRISHDEAVSCLITTNPEEVTERNASHEQLVQLQAQLVEMKEHLAEQQEIAAEAEEMRRQLADQKTQFEDMCAELQNRLTEEKGKSQTLLQAIKNLQSCQKDLEGQLANVRVARNSLEFQVNGELTKTQREKTNLEQHVNELKSSLSAAESQNEELQSVLDNVESEKSNLAKELKEMKKRNSNPKIEELTNDLKAVALSETDADGDIRRLKVLLQETQSRIQDAERIKAEQARKTGNLERKHGNAHPETKQARERKQTIICDGFYNDNNGVTVSSCKRSIKANGVWGYCFLDHPKIEKNQVLQWTLRVPKFIIGSIGMVIILE